MSWLAGTDTVGFHPCVSISSLLSLRRLCQSYFPQYSLFFFTRDTSEGPSRTGRCGRTHRLPNFDDRPRLPYIDAILLEALRWNPVGPTGIYFQIHGCYFRLMAFGLGMAHRSVKDDVYRGYYIPRRYAPSTYFEVQTHPLRRGDHHW